MSIETLVKCEENQVFEQDGSLILDNQYVFIQLPSGNIKVVKLQKDTNVSLGKFGTFHSNGIIGRPFGHSYEIYDRDQVKVIKNVAFYEVDETDANNKEILDDPSKQKLSYQEIEKLKKQGLEGQDIIKKMVESHSAFDQKTEYSKAKYIKRKEAKFSRVFTPVKPTLYSVWEYFFSKNPGKIRDMRIDTLSQILSLANVRAYTKMLVVDDTQGLVVTGVMERLGGYGIVLGIHDSENHNYDIVRYMNFSKKIHDSLMTLSWQQVFKEMQVPFNYQDESTLSEKDLKYYLRRKTDYERIRDTREILWKGEFDGLIVASQYQPESILESLMPYLSGSRPIIIYHINKEVLINACVHMRISKKFLNPQITESWLRQYQVLPGRTHPSMSTSGGGGYLLHATHVIINDSLPTPIPSYMKQKDTLEGADKSSEYHNNNAINETNEKINLEQNVISENYLMNNEELQEVDNKKARLD
ncbi:Gcd10p-domain-containing protein [Glomus cerebriforme]|uniref:tRNA (adenine(58)-N(1))-methyltransferase non-catalytic subunit TRM6 n=1 Tax=Glomus cerebriforme TaxID=658196 RepID=A0A397SAF7_9GLOM|nr:Gcd10p-domain-containing protein [Glomus cerebriforme]